MFHRLCLSLGQKNKSAVRSPAALCSASCNFSLLPAFCIVPIALPFGSVFVPIQTFLSNLTAFPGLLLPIVPLKPFWGDNRLCNKSYSQGYTAGRFWGCVECMHSVCRLEDSGQVPPCSCKTQVELQLLSVGDVILDSFRMRSL